MTTLDFGFALMLMSLSSLTVLSVWIGLSEIEDDEHWYSRTAHERLQIARHWLRLTLCVTFAALMIIIEGIRWL